MTNWEDTVMTLEQIYNAKAYAYNKATGSEDSRELDGDIGIAKAQATISFKAGSQDVIDWLDEHNVIGFEHDDPPEGSPVNHYASWARKIKEWGIKEQNMCEERNPPDIGIPNKAKLLES